MLVRFTLPLLVLSSLALGAETFDLHGAAPSVGLTIVTRNHGWSTDSKVESRSRIERTVDEVTHGVPSRVTSRVLEYSDDPLEGETISSVLHEGLWQSRLASQAPTEAQAKKLETWVAWTAPLQNSVPRDKMAIGDTWSYDDPSTGKGVGKLVGIWEADGQTKARIQLGASKSYPTMEFAQSAEIVRNLSLGYDEKCVVKMYYTGKGTGYSGILTLESVTTSK